MISKNGIHIILIPALLFGARIFGQPLLPIPSNIQTAIKNETRSPDGRPGSKYWQNTANYKLDINFDPQSRIISGVAEIQYFNNSPDTLREIWFKLYPNLYKTGSMRMVSIDPKDIGSGMDIRSLRIGSDSAAVVPSIQGTNMHVSVKPVNPGQSIIFSIHYSYTLNKHSHIRTGEVEPGSDFIAYFFPRIAVYDDIDGWNKTPYLGVQEFYNDFCHFFVSVTVPQKYIVWATGDLKNSRELFNSEFVKRIDSAGQSDQIVSIVDSADLQAANILTGQSTTWKFEAADVTDFALATSDHYIWQASSVKVDSLTGRRSRIDAVFNPTHKSFFNVCAYGRKTIEAMSYQFPKWPYPYNHETVFDGLDQMEYPMMVNDNPLTSTADDIELTDHEIFHTMFPFYMGTNETKYGWMDEGWATLGEWLISPMIDSTISDEYGMHPYETSAGSEMDLPILTPTTQLTGVAMFTNSYPKPALGYLFVKDFLGDEVFYKGLHYYIGLWHGKHPGPYDFFNCMNAGSGHNLDWFWKKWFIESGIPNIAVTKLLSHGNDYAAVITLKGSKPVPVDLAVYFDDGSIERFHRNISYWENGNTAISIPFTTKKKVKKLVAGSVHIPDSDKSDNVFDVEN